MKLPKRLAVFSCLSALALAPPAVVAATDPCSSPGDTTVGDVFAELSSIAMAAEPSDDETRAATDTGTQETLEATLAELARRASGDGLSDDRLDLIHRLFVALDLGEVEEDDGSLVFHFNHATGFAPRVIVHQSELYKPLAAYVDTLDEEVREVRRKALEDGLDDLDDVELLVRWNPRLSTPRGQLAVVEDLARAMFDEAYRGEVTSASEALRERAAMVAQELKASIEAERSAPADGQQATPALMVPMAEVCRSMPHTLVLIVQKSAEMQAAGEQFRGLLAKALQEVGFFALADLLEGEHRFTLEGSFRRRVGAVGPNEGTVSARYDWGWVSYRGYRAWLQDQGRALGSESARQYLAERSPLLPKISVSLDYSDRRATDIPIPGEVAGFHLDGGRKITGVLRAGGFFDGSRQSRWELKTTYDLDTDDPVLEHHRFVGNFSWVERLGPALASALGGSDVVVTLVYANKPEFRGEVDEDLTLRAGLKWSLGSTGTN